MGSNSLFLSLQTILSKPHPSSHDLCFKPYSLGWQLIKQDFNADDLLFKKIIISLFAISERKFYWAATTTGVALICPVVNTITIVALRYFFSSQMKRFLPPGPSALTSQEEVEKFLGQTEADVRALQFSPDSTGMKVLVTPRTNPKDLPKVDFGPTFLTPTSETSSVTISQEPDENATALTFYWPSEYETERACLVKGWLLQILRNADWDKTAALASPQEILQLEACILQWDVSSEVKDNKPLFSVIIAKIKEYQENVSFKYSKNYFSNIDVALSIVKYEGMMKIYLADISTDLSTIGYTKIEINKSPETKKTIKKILGSEFYINPMLYVAIGIFLVEYSNKDSPDFKEGINCYFKGIDLIATTCSILEIDKAEQNDIINYITSPKLKLDKCKQKAFKRPNPTDSVSPVFLSPDWILFFKVHRNFIQKIRGVIGKEPTAFNFNVYRQEVKGLKSKLIAKRRCSDPAKRVEYTISYKELRTAGIIT